MIGKTSSKIIGIGMVFLLSITLFNVTALAVKGTNDPYISLPSYMTYDAGSDGKDDSVEVDFFIETNITVNVSYIVDLYSNSDVLINETTSDTFELNEGFIDVGEDMGSVSSDGYYYVTIELYNHTQSGDYLVDSWQSDSFYLYAKDTAYSLEITVNIPNAKKISQSITVNGEKYNVPYQITAGEKIKMIVKVIDTNKNQPVSGAKVSMYTMGVYDPSTDTATLTAAGHFSPQNGTTDSSGEFLTYYYPPSYKKIMYVFVSISTEIGDEYSSYSFVVKIAPKSISQPTSTSVSNFLFQNILGIPLWIWLAIVGVVIGIVLATILIVKSKKKKQPQALPTMEKEMEKPTNKTLIETEEKKEEGLGLESIEKQLEKLKSMKEKGLISDEDYEKMKNKLLENEIGKGE